MADQQQCQRCRGERTLRSETDPYQFDPCPACDGTGKKSAEKLRDTGTGQEGLPADLIDRAVEIAAPVWREGCYDERDLGEVLEAAAPLLVEHGRQQEKTRWEARIEKRIEDRERARDTYRPGTRIHAELNDRVILLRSLLTGEGENGE